MMSLESYAMSITKQTNFNLNNKNGLKTIQDFRNAYRK